METTYLPPARITDFDRSGAKDQLYKYWHKLISGYMTKVNPNRPATPAFFDALKPPTATLDQASPEWPGLPNMLIAMNDGDLLAAAKVAEVPVRWGDQDPAHPAGISYPQVVDAKTNQRLDLYYRPQDEYLEWSVQKDDSGVITAIDFTCEGPEYWEALGNGDKDLATKLYQEISGDNSIQKQDLFFDRDVRFVSGSDISREYSADDYNPWNKWNMKYAIHLTHDSNSLGAEVNLGRDASYLWGSDSLKTTDPALICCGGYGEINRMSDPTIGSKVNGQIQKGKQVTLRNPVGLYIKSLDEKQFSLDGNAVPDVKTWFVPIRPTRDKVSDMILRARFEVPQGVLHKGKQLRVGDLTVDHNLIITGGQVAHRITMTLYALACAGAPKQTPRNCHLAPCPNAAHPDYIDGIPYGSKCGTDATAALTITRALHEPALMGLLAASPDYGNESSLNPAEVVPKRMGTVLMQ
jgi:hypothetical protein